MNFPGNLRYSKLHEWLSVEDDIATIGITDYAQQLLGCIGYIKMPTLNAEIIRGEEFCIVESVKAVFEMFAPASGKIVQVNELLKKHPEHLNECPYGEGWIIKIRLGRPSELDDLLDSSEYKNFIKE